jgi:hypothetical protein
MPPPPGSKRSFRVRTLRSATMASASLAMSRLGFSVRVTMRLDAGWLDSGRLRRWESGLLRRSAQG